MQSWQARGCPVPYVSNVRACTDSRARLSGLSVRMHRGWNEDESGGGGGGLAGLSCAVALSERGLAVTVLESSERPGGRASSWTDAETGDTVDIGPHIFHSEYHNMLGSLERLGTSRLITWQPGKVLTIASKPEPLPPRRPKGLP
jgi:Flavin containing amine oxidoreductase